MDVINVSSIFQHFTTLGNQVEATYRRCNYNDTDLSAIAADALTQFKEEFSFDTVAIADFLATTTIGQQPGLSFSDLPLTVYWQRNFYIEILIWTNSTTAVHQHGFSGAFKVLQGSSLHTTFDFQPKQVISSDCIYGVITPQRTDYFQRGSIQPINPGSEGLIHSLYHLDNPSLTLVIRSHGHKRHQPQYSFYRPHLALNPFQLEKDELVAMNAKLLYVANQLDRESMVQVWLDHIARLDFARLANLFLENSKYFRDEAEQEAFFSKAKQTHGELIDALKQVARYQERLDHISHSRTILSDPDLRYFLALLMNAKDKTSLLKMVKIRYPEQEPLECCARWLARLSEGKVDTARRLAQVVQQANVGGLHLGRKLGVALPPNVSDSQVQDLFLSFVRYGGDVDDLLVHHPDINPAELRTCFSRLANLEELSCLNT